MDARHRASSSGGIVNPPTSPDPNLYDRPVIGILTHPYGPKSSYIAASYVKFVECAGARVIPLIYNESMEKLTEKLKLVNGVLFTGGTRKRGLYFDIARMIFEKIKEKKDAGDHVPLFAICLGFEILSIILSKDRKVLQSFEAGDQPSTLQFIKNIENIENKYLEGTVFQRFSKDLLCKLSTECLAMQSHHQGVHPTHFENGTPLSGFFKILTTSKAIKSRDYVSTVQGLEYPVTGVQWDPEDYVSTVQGLEYPVTGFQWHPEKNAFESKNSMIPHREDADQVTKHVADFFISEARKSTNRPPKQNVLDNLTNKYRIGYSGTAREKIYFFSRS